MAADYITRGTRKYPGPRLSPGSLAKGWGCTAARAGNPAGGAAPFPGAAAIPPRHRPPLHAGCSHGSSTLDSRPVSVYRIMSRTDVNPATQAQSPQRGPPRCTTSHGDHHEGTEPLGTKHTHVSHRQSYTAMPSQRCYHTSQCQATVYLSRCMTQASEEAPPLLSEFHPSVDHVLMVTVQLKEGFGGVQPSLPRIQTNPSIRDSASTYLRNASVLPRKQQSSQP